MSEKSRRRNSGSAEADHFRSLLEETVVLLRDRGRQARPYRSAALNSFQRLPAVQRAGANRALENYVRILKQRDEPSKQKMVRQMLEALTWRAPFGAVDGVTDDMMFEIYDTNCLQVFRSVDFFKISGPSLEELCTIPWFELWERDAKTLEYMMELNRMLLNNEITGCISLMISKYEVRDYNARLNSGPLMKPLYLAPLFEEGGANAGHLLVFKV